MTDQAPAPIADVGPVLDAAKSAGAQAYVAKHAELVASGHTIPYAHTKAVGEVSRAISNAAEGGVGGPLSKPQAYQWAEHQAAKGTPAAVIIEQMHAMGHEWAPPAEGQKLGERWIHAEDYFVPHPTGLTAEGYKEWNTDARALAGELNMTVETGNSFIRQVSNASTELTRAGYEADALVQKWEGRLAGVFPDPAKLAEAKALVESYLKDTGARMGQRIVEHKAYLEPSLFMLLRNRALAAKE